MASYEITFKIDVPETKAGKPTAAGKRTAAEWSDKLSVAFEQITCSDEMGDRAYFAGVFEGWGGGDLERIRDLLHEAGAGGGTNLFREVETLLGAWEELHREFEQAPGARLIQNERLRQIHSEGYDAKHDDEHNGGELLYAAAVYALAPDPTVRDWWPWRDEELKIEGDHKLNLAKAGALIAAEIDRLERAGVAS